MKCLVTGGGGFLGKEIARQLLAKGYKVRSIGRSPQSELEAWGIETLQGDLTKSADVEDACTGVDVVFHVAARAGVWGTWDDFYQPNVVGTRNILAACKKLSIKRLVYTSTPSVVFNGQPFEGADEALPYGSGWLCHYAHTKAIAEEEALAANNTDGVRVCALRPHLIWGVGDPHLVPRLLDRAKSGRLRRVGEGTNKVDLTHVQNAAHAHLLALDALENGKASGKAYFLSDGEPVNLWNWINKLLTALGEKPIEKNISMNAAYRLGQVLETAFKVLPLKGEPPMTRFVAVELAKSHWFSVEAARKDLGYEPVITPQEGMSALLESYKKA